MYIKNIKPLKNNVIIIVLENDEMHLVNRLVFIKSKLKLGENVSKDFVEKLIYESDLEFAKEKALRFLDKKQYLSDELLKKLKLYYKENVAKITVENLKRIGLIDDLEILKKKIDYLISTKLYSKKRIFIELKNTGIETHFIKDALDNIESDEIDNIKKLILKNYKNFKKDRKIENRAIAFLIRYGYSIEKIKKALSDINI